MGEGGKIERGLKEGSCVWLLHFILWAESADEVAQ